MTVNSEFTITMCIITRFSGWETHCVLFFCSSNGHLIPGLSVLAREVRINVYKLSCHAITRRTDYKLGVIRQPSGQSCAGCTT